mmetsp:Transcript_34619/g.89775  ORF Transcript_34619/g.89775 Transcript_34619/m.89775 type:complete len:150 (-) Transcript_34619:114-563(-)
MATFDAFCTCPDQVVKRSAGKERRWEESEGVRTTADIVTLQYRLLSNHAHAHAYTLPPIRPSAHPTHIYTSTGWSFSYRVRDSEGWREVDLEKPRMPCVKEGKRWGNNRGKREGSNAFQHTHACMYAHTCAFSSTYMSRVKRGGHTVQA